MLPGSAAACLPHNCRQSLSQLPSLARWSVRLTNSIPCRPASTAVVAQAGLQEAAVAASTPAQKLPAFLEDLQNRQNGRLRSPIFDKQGRIMLKNLTRGELADWFEMQGMTHLHSSWQASHACMLENSAAVTQACMHSVNTSAVHL